MMTAIDLREGPFGTLSDSTTLRIERRLSGPIERVWEQPIDSELRRQ